MVWGVLWSLISLRKNELVTMLIVGLLTYD